MKALAEGVTTVRRPHVPQRPAPHQRRQVRAQQRAWKTWMMTSRSETSSAKARSL